MPTEGVQCSIASLVAKTNYAYTSAIHNFRCTCVPRILPEHSICTYMHWHWSYCCCCAVRTTSACNMPKADNRQNSPDLKRQPHPFFVLQKATKALRRSCAMCRWTLACLEPWQGLFRVFVTLGAQTLLQRAPLQPWWVGTWTASGTSLAK